MWLLGERRAQATGAHSENKSLAIKQLIRLPLPVRGGECIITTALSGPRKSDCLTAQRHSANSHQEERWAGTNRTVSLLYSHWIRPAFMCRRWFSRIQVWHTCWGLNYYFFFFLIDAHVLPFVKFIKSMGCFARWSFKMYLYKNVFVLFTPSCSPTGMVCVSVSVCTVYPLLLSCVCVCVPPIQEQVRFAQVPPSYNSLIITTACTPQAS